MLPPGTLSRSVRCIVVGSMRQGALQFWDLRGFRTAVKNHFVVYEQMSKTGNHLLAEYSDASTTQALFAHKSPSSTGYRC